MARVVTASILIFAIGLISPAFAAPPVVIGPLADIAMNEDDPSRTVDVSSAFDDVDIPDGDVLTYEVSLNSDPSLFSDVSFVGADLTLSLAANANGSSDITVIAVDSDGAQSPGVTFTVTVAGVDDVLNAVDDAFVIVEDVAEATFDVLANDEAGDPPTIILSLGSTGQHSFINATGDTITQDNGTVRVEAGQVVYEPAPDFWGTDTFTYTIQDSQGEEGTATVTVTVDQENDPPSGTSLRLFSVFEGGILAVSSVNGLFLGVYDIDGQILDENGDPVGSPLSLETTAFPDPSEGEVNVNGDGSFTFTPAVGFLGSTTFAYRLSDSEGFSPEYMVQIEVVALPPAPETPDPGAVTADWNLSDSPLEQSATVSPNVLVTMDDSGSMDWNVSIDGNDEQGMMELDNAAIAAPSLRSDFAYLFDLSVNSYAQNSEFGARLPSESSLPIGNQHGVWRARNSSFNSIYYDPEVTYLPWTGQDIANNDFADADPENVRLDPTLAGLVFDLLTEVDYLAYQVPNWDVNGGASDVMVTGYYIPRYYTSTDAAPLAWNSQHSLVEIRPLNAPFAHATPREDCSDGNALTCTYEQEIQNFANWFQYYRSRELVAKAALGVVVARLQDVRVGYETINQRVNEEIADMNEHYWEGEKRGLLDAIYSTNSADWTPLRNALDRSGRILNCTFAGRDCPALPAPEGICQQNFSLLFSDGYWNGPAPEWLNEDGDLSSIFDGGKYADGFSTTLADIAMHYYETDLIPGVDDGVPLTARDIAGVPQGTFSDTDTLHQHMKTFTIAFGVEGDMDPVAAVATDPATAIAWVDPNVGGNAKIDDMMHAAINGRGSYLSAGNPEELQSAIDLAFVEFTQAASSTSSAAFSSTSVREGTLLYRGFFDLRSNTGEVTATEIDTAGVLAPTPTWTAAALLDPVHPDGLSPDERVIVTFDRDTMSGIPFRYGSLNADQQLILDADQVAYLRGDHSNEAPGGVLRTRPDDVGNLGDIINSSLVLVGQPTSLNRDQAPYPTGSGNLFSEFASSQTDRQPIVYVGANDGMLHGFDAETGIEQVAYVPNIVIDASDRFSNKLSEFTSPFYLHNNYVDMTPRVRDIYSTSNLAIGKHWMTAMIGGLGSGGKGFFALDVTDPTVFGSESTADDAVLWEFSEADDTYPINADGTPLGGAIGAVVDGDGMPVRDLGFSLSVPSIVMSNVGDGTAEDDREWIVVFGNGPNSTSGIAKLFALRMNGALDGSWDAGDFTKLDTGFGAPLPGEPLEGFPNYLGAPTMVDVDNNGTADLAYAGDRLGHLYRFDLSSDDFDDWTATLLFTAIYDDAGVDQIQPILTQPLVVKHPDQPGYVVSFGTGSFVTEEDGANTEIQSIYGIWDPLTPNPITTQPDTKELRLVEQVMTNVVDDTVNPSQTRRVLTSNAVEYAAESDGAGTYGWYIDLDIPRASDTISGGVNPDLSGNPPPGPQFPGEKAIRRFVFRDGAVITPTVLPATDATSCFGVRPGAILVFSAMTGGDFGSALIDFNSDGVIDEDDMVMVDGVENSAGLLFNQNDLAGSLVDLSVLGSEGDTDFLVVSGGSDTIFFRIDDLNDSKTGRLSWTEIENLQ